MAEPRQQLPSDLGQFSNATAPSGDGISIEDYKQLVNRAKIRDIQQRIDYRPKAYFSFSLLLFAQNMLVFELVALGLGYDRLQGLQLIFSTLIAGTLLQSYAIVKLMVVKIFDNDDYKDHHDSLPEKIGRKLHKKSRQQKNPTGDLN